MGVQPDEAEKIGLLAAILGWEVEPLHGVGRVRSWIGGFPDAFGAREPAPWPRAAGGEVAWVDGAPVKGHWAAGTGAQDVSGSDGDADRRAASSRLVLRQTDNVIRVDVAENALAAQLARLGLDRLVLPVSLLALEELLAFAG
jgi:hypothetical protein